MQCAVCERELEAFTGDVCPHCQHFAHPTRLGIYDGLELIKRGGMGSVYRARHPELGTVVAIKTVHTHTGPETLAERFEQEARLSARIPHPGVVRVFDYDCQEGRLYLVMEFVDGETLRPVVADDQRDIAWRLDKVAQLADILHAAHEKGIVHRDVKPENVMVDSTERVRVLDFGISRVLDDGERLTQTGEILGTPEYISPEQILDVPEAVDARTDVYATGVVLYELLTGHSPFAGTNLFQVLKNVESLDPPPPSQLRSGLPAGIDDLVMACIAKDKAARPPDCRVLARRVRELIPRGVVRGRPRVMLIAVVGALCMIAGWAIRDVTIGEPLTGSSGELTTTPTEFIQMIVEAGPPFARTALVSCSRAIPDGASAQGLFWRGMARKHTGSLFLALRDFEAAGEAGFDRAKEEASAMWACKHTLYPRLLGASALRADSSQEIVGDHLPVRWSKLLDASVSTEELERALRDIERMAPFRYFLEAVVAIRTSDEARLRAALELAQVTGEANFAAAVYLATRLERPNRFSEAEKGRIRQMAEELTGPHALTIRKKVQERLQ